MNGNNNQHNQSEDAKADFDKMSKDFTAQAHQIIHEVMPQKIVHLHQQYQELPMYNRSIDEVTKETSLIAGMVAEISAEDAPIIGKKRKLSTDHKQSALIPSNKYIMVVVEHLKAELIALIEMLGVVKIWIQLNIPRIEDGNNFGVSIQEETVSEINRAEDTSFVVLESFAKYFMSRGKLISKVLKYPGVKDYLQSCIELDEKEYINLKLCCIDLRNTYAILHDMIVKNMEKISKPRGTSDHRIGMF